MCVVDVFAYYWIQCVEYVCETRSVVEYGYWYSSGGVNTSMCVCRGDA